MKPEDGEIASATTDGEAKYISTVLDWLNDDLWRIILDYIPAKDIIRSERVSIRWQGVVHRYLQEVGICVAVIRGTFAQRNVKRQPKNRIVQISNCRTDEEEQNIRIRLFEKWGPYIVYTYCYSRSELEKIAQFCPNLKGLAIHMYQFESGPLSQTQIELCEKLEQLAFLHFTFYNDLYHYDDEVAISFSKEDVSRAFCANLKPTNLKSLTICGEFDYQHFLASIESFPKLTELFAQGKSTNIPLLLNKTPKLERLGIFEVSYHHGTYSHANYKLDHLKHLTLYYTYMDTRLLDPLAHSELRSLTLLRVGDDVLREAMKLIVTRWRTLDEFRADHHDALGDDAVMTIIESCPHLTLVDLSDSESVTPELVGRAARATIGRAVRLRLKMDRFKNADTYEQKQYPELIVDLQEPRQYCPIEYRLPFEHIDADYD